jgi:hypothetical protein
MDTKQSSVFRPETDGADTHPHACTDGLVYLAYASSSTRNSAPRSSA